MAKLQVGSQTIEASSGSNLLEALLSAGLPVPHSCRSGACQSCLVQCNGALLDLKPQALSELQRSQGWRLACQSQICGDIRVQPFAGAELALNGTVVGCDWLAGQVLRLRVLPERAVRYAAGQYVNLTYRNITRPYSLASLPGEDRWLEFHIDCSAPGAFSSVAKLLGVGQSLSIGAVQGALRYDAAWQDAPLWLLAAGTGLAPLWGVLREALRQGHRGPVHVLHVGTAYLTAAVGLLLRQHPQVQCLHSASEDAWQQWGRPHRGTQALLCGSPARVERWQRGLFLAGLSRPQILTEAFSS